MEEKKDSFVFYKSFMDIIEIISDEQMQLKALKTIIRYGLYKEEPTDDAPEIIKVILTSVRTPIDNAQHRYNVSVENGKKGGRPRKDKNLTKPSKTQQSPNKPDANLNDNDNDNDNDNVNDNATDKPGFAAVAAVENKDQSLEERKNDFYTSLIPFKGQYGNGLIQEFFNYYSQTNNESGKMRFENDSYFNAERILAKWKKNQRTTNKSEIGRVLTDSANKEYKQEW